MKLLYISLILLSSFAHGQTIDENVKHSFGEFKKAMLTGDCGKMEKLSQFPIQSDIGLARILKSEESKEQMEKYNYQITKEMLIGNCSILKWQELETLSRFNIESPRTSENVKYENCWYECSIFVAKDNSYYQWTVGCVHLINKSIGEYSLVFTFDLINGEYKLTQIHGVG